MSGARNDLQGEGGKVRDALKRAVLSALGTFGLEVHRRPLPRVDPIRKGDINALWRDWIDRDVQRFARIYVRNRHTQRRVPEWISEGVLDHSLWRYGMPRNELLQQLNGVDCNITYSDVLCYLATWLTQPRYLEIGVSAGKNLYQMSQQLRDAVLVGIDIEDINPILEHLLGPGTLVWKSAEAYPFTKFDGTEAWKKFSLMEFSQHERGNTIFYLSGDKFERALWERLEGKSFNLIFSDAHHTQRSLETEFTFLTQYGLIDSDEFIMLWDDVSDDVLPAVARATTVLRQQFSSSRPYTAVIDIHGTYGGGEQGLHSVAVFVHDKALSENGAGL